MVNNYFIGVSCVVTAVLLIYGKVITKINHTQVMSWY